MLTNSSYQIIRFSYLKSGMITARLKWQDSFIGEGGVYGNQVVENPPSGSGGGVTEPDIGRTVVEVTGVSR